MERETLEKRKRLTDSYKKIMEEEAQLGRVFLEKEDIFFCLRNGTKGGEMKGNVSRKGISIKKRKVWKVYSGLRMEPGSLSRVLRTPSSKLCQSPRLLPHNSWPDWFSSASVRDNLTAAVSPSCSKFLVDFRHSIYGCPLRAGYSGHLGILITQPIKPPSLERARWQFKVCLSRLCISTFTPLTTLQSRISQPLQGEDVNMTFEEALSQKSGEVPEDLTH